MKGKILEYGIILGDDGLKYSFSYDDIMNLSQKGRQKLENLGVDFIPDNDTATEIYLLIKENSATQSDTLQTKITRRKPKAENFESQNTQNDSENKESYYNSKSWQKGENSQDFQKTQIDSIKKKAYIMLICYALCFLVVPLIVAIVLNVLIVLELQKVSQSKTLFKNFIISIVLPIVIFLLLVLFLVLFALDFSDVMNIDEFLEKLDNGGFGILLGMIIILPAYYFDYLYSKELAYITNQPYFMHSFWASLISALTSEISYVLFAVFFIVCIVFYVIAWIKFKEIIIVKEK